MQCGVRELYMMHQEMICLGSSPNDAMWDQGVLYYALGNEMFRKNAMMQCGAREFYTLCIRK